MSKYTSRCPAEPFEDENFWSFLVLFFLNFELKCLDFDHQFRSSLSALLSESLAEILKTSFGKESLLLISNLNGKMFGLVPSMFQQGNQNSNFGFYSDSLCNENFSHKNISFFWCFRTLVKYSPKCMWKVSGEVIKTAFKVSRRLCWAIRFFEKALVI